MSKDYIYTAVVRSIYDGDSIRADIDLGFNNWIINEPIRLHGINAPEIRGEERADGLVSKEWLMSKIPVGTVIELHTIKDRTGKYGRYLGVIYTDDGININKQMIEEGYAKHYFG